MSNIDLITSKVNEMSASLTTWNRIVIYFVAATAIVAAFYFVASYVAHIKAMQLDKAKDELIQLKDREQAFQLAKVKTDSEENIARVKAEAEKQIAMLNTETTKARSEIAKAQAQAAQANAEAAKANEKAEAERITRIKMEDSLSPRRMVISSSTDTELSLFAGTKVYIFSAAEAEPSRLATEIGNVLKERGGWILLGTEHFSPIISHSAHIEKGVNLWTKEGTSPKATVSDTAWERAAKVFSCQLNDILITSRVNSKYDLRPTWPENVPADAIMIRVGMKPDPYFNEKFFDEMDQLLPISDELVAKIGLSREDLRRHSEEFKRWTKQLNQEDAEREKRERQAERYRIIEEQKRFRKNPEEGYHSN